MRVSVKFIHYIGSLDEIIFI